MLRSAAIRSLEAAGLVVYAYLIGGVITDIRLFVAGLPSGPQMLTTVPNGQLVATGAKAMSTWGAAALGILVIFSGIWLAGDAFAKVIVRVMPSRRKDKAKRLGLGIIVLLMGAGFILESVLDPTQGPTAGVYAYSASVVSLAIALAVVARGIRRNRHVSRSASIITAVGAADLAGAFLAMTALVSVGAALDGPTKLSMATAYEKNGMCTSGPLVASTGEGAYFGDGKSHSVTLIRSETIEKLVVERTLVVVKNTRVLTAKC